MKITNRNLGNFIGFLLLFCIAGTLSWELLEAVLNAFGLSLNLNAGPVGFDVEVLTVYFSANPGTPLGLAAGWFLFRRI